MSDKQTAIDGTKLTPAQVEWQNDTPVSVQFDDIYFNKDGGQAETEHVFLAANQLQSRWQQLTPGGHFCIAETGFGTGLNFLCARKLWLQTAPESARLHFFSCEKYPLSRADLSIALEHWPQFSAANTQLVSAWPPAAEGFYTLEFDDGRISLTLAFGDAAKMLAAFDGQVDAWFLDGFAPSRNPDMWSDGLFTEIARHSAAGTTFGTFTAAGIVRRGLASSGFHVEKRPGFGHKRDMLVGRFEPHETQQASHSPWLARPTPHQGEKHAIIIGAGIAGACTAAVLANRGWQVDVLERNPEAALEGSGNPQGALYLKLPKDPTRQGELHQQGLYYSAALVRRLAQADPDTGDICGLLSLALTPQELKRQQQLLEADRYPDELVHPVDAEQAAKLAGVPLGAGGLYFPEGGWASPRHLCQQLLQHPAINCHFETKVESLVYDAMQSRWQINDGEYTAPVVVVCSASDSAQLEPLSFLPIKPIRGQTTQSPKPENMNDLRTVVCGEGYISPPLNGQYCYGASFKVNDPAREVRQEEQQHNHELLARAIPPLAENIDLGAATGRVAFRATTPDYMPIVGAVPDLEWTLQRFERLRHDARWTFEPGMQHQPGLFVNAGHGSKGLLSCPISAQVIAALIEGSPLPVTQAVGAALNPVRFTIKKLVKGTI
ncbi:bifunctional tRNA (5-methylaminomethyl-2-thiouridine)(34)-methyltransferase MnmD/FAD-dependent 5-carboxymethylaminomethyl-2-thiouridine(34) oxidoreductase MnmC [Marinobacterium lutimaris]|uniref:tRNA 5-methylaminomethyl-2-thiouridine biosynthesis bifunctional protein MnmC n=1 Tax=Marinobacterium lutimaris TaxID=568106 RepID=A0A1H6BA50_9GAMM|nr:bifunctional tRNA (5-methylaminomethyl-2-thiouridine)(34)-methyltransferase MnmD/FAD-dependent 5-carboxymethylaminomethyl-2-thiouridine(34) oxidoreductase MnmC [Marinobacterium lutimaris]SEG57741.1 tRNA 5-methylaminomethyl-2-thiouridine biosynthesis bifunctional protein [Marinobacterium lutimaris]